MDKAMRISSPLHRLTAIVAASILAGGLLAGCGGDDDPKTKPTPKVTDFSMPGDDWDGKPAPKWPKLTQDEKDVYEVVEQTFHKSRKHLISLLQDPKAAVARTEGKRSKLAELDQYEREDLGRADAKTVIKLANLGGHVEGAETYPWVVPVSVDLDKPTPTVVFDACTNNDDVVIVYPDERKSLKGQHTIWRYTAVPNFVTPRGNWDEHQWVIVKEKKVGKC